MRKGLAVAAVAAVALAAPGSAGAGQGKKKYSGVFESGGTMSFVVKKTASGKKVFNFNWQNFPLNCNGTLETSSDGLSFAVRVKDQQFRTRAADVDAQGNVDALLRLKGQLEGRVKASGTMSIEGRDVRVDGGGRKKCDSGRVNWEATTLAAPDA